MVGSHSRHTRVWATWRRLAAARTEARFIGVKSIHARHFGGETTARVTPLGLRESRFPPFVRICPEIPTAHGATDVRIATVTQSSHWVAQEQPSQVARLIDRFAVGSP